MPDNESFRERLGRYLLHITPEQVVGASGLAVLCASSALAFAPATGQPASVALGQYLSGLGLNVLAGVLQNLYSSLLSEPGGDDREKLADLAASLTPVIQGQPKLRSEIGAFLNTVDAVRIAEQILKGDPATHGWLLVSIFQEVDHYRTDFAQVHKTLAEIKALQKAASRLSAPDYPFTVPPLPPQRVFGREADLRNLRDLLATHDKRMGTPPVSLLGMGGIGKTTLAVALGRLPGIALSFPHGVFWAELGPKPSIRAGLIEWGSYIGIDLSLSPDESSCSQRLRRALHHRRALLIVDDVWDSADGQFFNVGGPQCRILFTTRELPVANDLATPDRVYSIGSIGPRAAFALLRALAPRVTSTEEAAAKELCRKFEYLPLAITLAGRYLANEALTHRRKRSLIEKLLTSAEERLALPQFEKRLGVESVTPSMGAILGLSVDRLEHSDQERFAMLSVFGGEPLSWTMRAATFIWDCTEDDAETTMTRLLQRGLVELWMGRYRMHALLADYAKVLSEAWGLDKAQKRFIRYHLQLARGQ